MNNEQFYKLLEREPFDGNVKLAHTWQFAQALKACADDAAVVALTRANPTLAADYAMQESVHEALGAPNPLHAAVAATPNDATALAVIAGAPAASRAEYANDLALAEYTQDDLCARYRELVLGEP